MWVCSDSKELACIIFIFFNQETSKPLNNNKNKLIKIIKPTINLQPRNLLIHCHPMQSDKNLTAVSLPSEEDPLHRVKYENRKCTIIIKSKVLIFYIMWQSPNNAENYTKYFISTSSCWSSYSTIFFTWFY